ncbi:hypothetical protein SUDANB6_01040 [Streptomyces sp. enrichment culture]|uniref:sensor histidine kinase n=1 Tax=Streptomyces sp. enrichment culture TaxID=1795815 RepID=UPI003F55572A
MDRTGTARSPKRRGLAERLRWCVRGLLVAVLSQAGSVVLLTVTVTTFAAMAIGIGFLVLPVVMTAVRGLADFHRRTAREWTGETIEAPYRWTVVDGAHDTAGTFAHCRRLLSDPATWRDILWMLLDAPVGLVLGLLPVSLVAYGLNGMFVTPFLWRSMGPHWGFGVTWFITDQGDANLAIPQGFLLAATGLLIAPALGRLYVRFNRALLAPTRNGRLALRVEQLTETRSAAVEAQAAELRRIERDLHDGAQARLVALGMKLGLADTQLETNPELARRLLAEAMESGSQALSELRDLVRGIHPPVLAERGLDGAVRALAVTLAIPVEVHIDLPGRPRPPIESAAYFVIAEVLANVTKHSGANRVSIRLRYADGRLHAEIGDNGRGGAKAEGGSGLRGLQRRLAAFDGRLDINSPMGGPTLVTMELPCEL